MDQLTLLRQMTPEQRLEQACKLSDLTRELAIKNIQTRKRLSRKAAIKEYMKMLYGRVF
jgi:hypothetical protein